MEDALKKSGFKDDFKYTKNQRQKPKNRSRNIIWFNPLFNKAVSTNIAKVFLQLINRHFPKSHRLHKIFNRNTVKVTYSCMQNMSKTYKRHNSKITSTPCNQLTLFNCQVKGECSMDGKCQTMDTVYNCCVTSPSNKKSTLGWQKENGSKGIITIKSHSIINNIHMRRHFKVIRETSNVTPNLKWSIVKYTTPYSNISKKCLFCFYEILVIIAYPRQRKLLNNRSELFCRCCHIYILEKLLLQTYGSEFTIVSQIFNMSRVMNMSFPTY